MPYSSISELPSATKTLPERAKRIFMSAFNRAFQKHRNEETSMKIAWAAVKQVFKKSMKGWELKKSYDSQFVYSSTFDSYKSTTNDDFFVEGYIEAPTIDLIGDLCTNECLKDVNNQLSDRVIRAKIGREHEHSLVDRNILHSAKIIKNHLDENGIFVAAKLNKFHPDFESTKGSIQEGLFDAFSIEYIPEVWKEDVILEDGTYVPRLLEKIHLTGVTFTGKPMNPEAVITNFGEGLIKSMAIKESEEAKAVWSKAFINELPDSSFAFISPDGRKDSEGKTVPRSLRHLPYKDKNGKIDLPHLRNALSRLSQTDITPEQKAKAKSKLISAAKEAGITISDNEKRKSLNQEDKKMTEEIKTPESVPETVTEQQPKEEVKSEVQAEVTKEDEIKSLREEVKSLKDKFKEEIKSIIIEEIKSIQPEQKNLVDTKEQKFPKEETKSDFMSQVTRQLGVKEA